MKGERAGSEVAITRRFPSTYEKASVTEEQEKFDDNISPAKVARISVRHSHQLPQVFTKVVTPSAAAWCMWVWLTISAYRARVTKGRDHNVIIHAVFPVSVNRYAHLDRARAVLPVPATIRRSS